jgi:3-keto-disaccharide hydrolase
MTMHSHRLIAFAGAAALILCANWAYAADGQWTALFDGKSLDGWEKVGQAASMWEVQDGTINGSGPASMLVCTKGPYKNFRYRAEVKINDGGNSGLYFRTTAKPTFSDGYEAQIDSTHRDPIRTGSLYGFCHVYKQLVKPDTWFTYELEVRDDKWRGRDMTRIKITVDGNELYEYLDFDKTFKEGHFAFQQHDPGSKVNIRKVEVMPLAD